MNLLQGEFAPSHAASGSISRFKVAIALASAVAVVHVGGTVTHWAALRLENAKIRIEMTDLFKTAFPQAVVVDPRLQMERNLVPLRRAAGQVTNDDFLPLLALAAPPLSQLANQRLKAISFEPGVLRIDVELGPGQEPAGLLERMRARTPGASLEAVNTAPSGASARYRVISAKKP